MIFSEVITIHRAARQFVFKSIYLRQHAKFNHTPTRHIFLSFSFCNDLGGDCSILAKN